MWVAPKQHQHRCNHTLTLFGILFTLWLSSFRHGWLARLHGLYFYFQLDANYERFTWHLRTPSLLPRRVTWRADASVLIAPQEYLGIRQRGKPYHVYCSDASFHFILSDILVYLWVPTTLTSTTKTWNHSNEYREHYLLVTSALAGTFLFNPNKLKAKPRNN